jgi:hypothetical protein
MMLWGRVLGAALLGWCLVAAVSALRLSLNRTADPMATLEAEFKPFLFELPPFATVGYLEQRDGGEDAVRMYYAAQYALVPRIVVGRVGPEFMIVARGTAQPDDPRLAGFYPVAQLANGHRLLRRLLP